MNLDWIALAIFVISVIYNAGVLRTVVRTHGDQLKDHEGRIRSLEGGTTRPGAIARGG